MSTDILSKFLFRVANSFATKNYITEKKILGGYQLSAIAPGFNDFSLEVTHSGKKKFIGTEKVMIRKSPFFGLAYSGYFIEDLTRHDIDIILTFLQRALMNTDRNMPIRGPQSYKEGKYSYFNQFEGGLDQCKGTEWIAVDTGGRLSKVYRMDYTGGIID